jgi:hypothetical protein
MIFLVANGSRSFVEKRRRVLSSGDWTFIRFKNFEPSLAGSIDICLMSRTREY